MNDSYTRSRKKKQSHYQQIARDRQQRVINQFQQWRQTQKCLCCGESESSCLDLHHLDPHEKEGVISDKVRQWKWERVWFEIQKCIVLCSNCHRKYHAGVIELPNDK
jgi:hypothetical protein